MIVETADQRRKMGRQKMVLKQLINYVKKKKRTYYFSLYANISSRCTADLNVKDKNHRTFVRKYRLVFS